MDSIDHPTKFETFHLNPCILQALQNYIYATPIQAQAIPVILQGHDVMGAAQTGTGKTAAFTIPVLERLLPFANSSTSPAKHPVRAVILTPTRELADQVYQNVQQYSAHTSLRSMVMFGGVDIQAQKRELMRGCEILVATPGRLLDHLTQKTVQLQYVSTLVLDEADRMLDMGFLPDLEKIMAYMPHQHQRLLFSATFSPEIRRLAHRYLHHPVEISVAPSNTTSENIEQIVYKVKSSEKLAAIHYLIVSQRLQQVIIFANRKTTVAQLTRYLSKMGVACASIHGDRSQQERLQALEQFKNGTIHALIATDVAARGLDIADLPTVINMEIPFNPEDYVHRIGRTGRAGQQGVAISLCSADEHKALQAIIELTSHSLKATHLSIPPAFVTADADATFDEFFYQPYEPEEQAHEQGTATTPTESYRSTTKKPLAVLLGGRPE